MNRDESDFHNRPFATNDHMVHGGGQAHYHSRTGTSKQRQVKLYWFRSLCFNVPVYLVIVCCKRPIAANDEEFALRGKKKYQTSLIFYSRTRDAKFSPKFRRTRKETAKQIASRSILFSSFLTYAVGLSSREKGLKNSGLNYCLSRAKNCGDHILSVLVNGI